MVTALYGGSFDPIHLGHLSVIEQASTMFEALQVVVLANPQKTAGLFGREQRANLARAATRHIRNVSVHEFDGLIVGAAAALKSDVLLRSAHKEGKHEQ